MNIRWLDLTHYGLAIRLYQSPSGRHYLVVQGEKLMDYAPQLLKFGFRLQDKEKLLHKAVTLRPDGLLNEVVAGEPYTKIFPKAEIVEYNPARHFAAAANQATEQAKSGMSKVNANLGEPIGRNRLGQEVFRSPEGERFVRDERGGQGIESETIPPNPGLFLRAVDDASLAACADGFVEAVARNRIVRAGDFEKFAEVVFEGKTVTDVMRARLRSEIETAGNRFLARKGGKSLSDTFVTAGKLSEAMVFLTDGRGDRAASPAGPMGIAAQRILGTEAMLTGKTVVAAGENPTSLVSRLTPAATVTAFSASADAATAVGTVMAAAGFRQPSSEAGRPKFDGAYATIFDQVAKRGRAAAGGETFARTDYAEVLKALEKRDPEGVSVFFLDAPAGAAETQELENLRALIAKDYGFEGEAHVNAALWRGRIEDSPRIMLSVGPKHDTPDLNEIPPATFPVDDWSTLWTWTAEVVMERARRARSTNPVDEVVLKAADPANGNSFQTPYVSASHIGTPSTMVPRNLESATRAALSKVVSTYGDVDVFIAREFGYTLEELGKYFSPEQIDALALYVHAENRNRGFLVADNTGIGKGRTLAAVMRRAILRGQKVMFLTEREPNLSDIWRDIVATGSADLFKPFILNTDAKIIDRNTKETVLRGADKADVDKLLASDTMPDGFNALFATYAQFNRDTAAVVYDGNGLVVSQSSGPAAKSKWLGRAVDKTVRLILDESHNASGDSNISVNVTKAVERAGGVTYSSATFAATSERMAFYAPLFPDDLSVAELSSMMSRGGETFQEVLSGMLAQDGVLIRREFDLSKVTFETKMDTTRFDRNRAMMDTLAPVLAEMASLSGEIDRRVTTLNDRRRAEVAAEAVRQQAAAAAAADAGQPVPAAPAAEKADKRVKAMQITRVGFGSPLYTIARLFVAALKVDVVVETAIETLQAGEKPVILVENTMQQLLEELAEVDGDDQVNADFRALLRRALRMMITTSWRDEKNKLNKRDISATDGKLKERVEAILKMIDDLPELPISVIDEVKGRVAAAGYTIDEITGRTLELRDGRVMRRPASNPTVIKNDFNDGVLDAIIINSSGATGIDLHASSTFPDQRRRKMLELQPPQDIVKKMQARGRINRYDQVVDPGVVAFMSGLPIEMRLNAMENAKLRRLSANTTSNRDAAQLSRDVPDLINPVGDIVCARYAEARPDLMRRLGFKVGAIEQMSAENSAIAEAGLKRLAGEIKVGAKEKRPDEGPLSVGDTKRSANEILARLIMLPVDLQTRVCNELTAEFHAQIEEMEARGETPLRVREVPGTVHMNERRIFDGQDSDNPDSVFHEPVFLQDAAVERAGMPIRAEDLAQRIQIGEMASGRAQSCIDRIRDGVEEILAPYLPENVASVADAITRGHKEIIERKQRLDLLVAALEKLKPGKGITISVDSELRNAIITRIDYPNRGYEHVPGLYGVEFVIPGDENPRSMRLETLLKDERFSVNEGLEGDNYDKVLKSYDDASKVKFRQVRLLTHNIFRAMRMNVEHHFGPLVTYRTADGAVHRGVMVTGAHRNLKNLPIEVDTPDMAYSAIVAGVELNGDKGMGDKTFSMRLADEGGVEIYLPPRLSKRHGHIYDDGQVEAMRKSAKAENKRGFRLVVRRDELNGVLGALYKAGAKFWANEVHRDKWLADYRKQRGEAAVPADEQATPVP